MLYWSRQHAVILQILTVMNMVFIVIFAFEATFKLIAYGSNYFRSGWNIIDLVVILLGIVGAALDYFISFDLGSSSSIIRSFRIGRLIRLIKKAKSLNMIFNTLIFTLPALANIGSLLFLGIFIFSIIGINNFAFLKNGNQINENANFRTFANSFFTLLRVSTGENWDGVLLDSVAYQQPNFVCYPILNYYDYERYGIEKTIILYKINKNNILGMMGCGTSWAYLYYIIFEVFFTMVFMNLFIAVVLEGFYQSHIEYDLHISENHLTQFKAIWKKYDPNAIGFIHINHLEDLLLNLESPLGWKKMNYNHKEKLMKVSRLNIPVYSIKRIKIPIYCFYDVANALAEHALIEEFKLIE